MVFSFSCCFSLSRYFFWAMFHHPSISLLAPPNNNIHPYFFHTFCCCVKECLACSVDTYLLYIFITFTHTVSPSLMKIIRVAYFFGKGPILPTISSSTESVLETTISLMPYLLFVLFSAGYIQTLQKACFVFLRTIVFFSSL